MNTIQYDFYDDTIKYLDIYCTESLTRSYEIVMSNDFTKAISIVEVEHYDGRNDIQTAM